MRRRTGLKLIFFCLASGAVHASAQVPPQATQAPAQPAAAAAAPVSPAAAPPIEPSAALAPSQPTDGPDAPPPALPALPAQPPAEAGTPNAAAPVSGPMFDPTAPIVPSGNAEPVPEFQLVNPAQMKLGAKDSYAVLKTSYGKMTVKLYTQYAPQTVRNFIALAKGEKEFSDVRTGIHVTRPFYNGLIFHRVIRGFLVQTGCPFGNNRGGPGYMIADEFHAALRHSRMGVVSMANEVEGAQGKAHGTPKPDTGGSQFFITLGPRPEFDGKYTIFGQVVEGLDTLERIGSAKTGPTNRPVKRIVLQSVDVVERAVGNK